MPWGVAYTYASQEARAVENLGRQGFEAFCPMYARPARRDVRSTVDSPLFPCYVFVALTVDQRWRCINGTRGVIRLLTSRSDDDPRPLVVGDDRMAEIQALSRSSAEPFPPGTVVRVRKRTSPLYDLVGTVVAMDKLMRVSVLMSVFQRDTMVEFVDPNDLEAVA